jgi:hypothetical protein
MTLLIHGLGVEEKLLATPDNSKGKFHIAEIRESQLLHQIRKASCFAGLVTTKRASRHFTSLGAAHLRAQHRDH